MKDFYLKYKHGIPLLIYGIIYGSWFAWLEKTVTKPKTIIHMTWDDYIPFCEYFIIPYLLWFGYIAVVVLFFFFKDKEDYYRVCLFLFTGMTIFLIVSTLWPNGHHLRPHIGTNENFFTQLVGRLYRTDTPTNLWPSIHVYNSIGVHVAVSHSKRLRDHKWVQGGSLLLCISIILSTMFLKQHSVFDVITAFIMAIGMYLLVYQVDIITLYRTRGNHEEKRIPQI